MWSCKTGTARRGAAALALAAFLGACGFQPVYGPGGSASALTGQVAFATPDDRDAYLLTQGIEGRLGRGDAPAYLLDTSVTVRSDGLAVTADGQITRYNLVGTADYTLSDGSTGGQVVTGTVTGFTGYSATGSTVATLAAERNARERLMENLAGQIVDRLILSVPPAP